MLSSSDAGLKTTFPGYLANNRGKGCVLESSALSLDVELQCVQSGDLALKFKGIDLKGQEGSRVPVRVMYAGYDISDKKAPLQGESEAFVAWHDRIRQATLSVTDGDILSLHTSWAVCPQPRTTIFALLCKLDPRCAQLEGWL